MDRYINSRRQDSEWRKRLSPLRPRSIQDTNMGAERDQHSSHRESKSQRQEIVNTPPPQSRLPPPPPVPVFQLEEQFTPKSRRPALERISGLEHVAPQNHFPVVSSSMSGRLQDVNIQYLGDEGQESQINNRTVLLGSSSVQLHPTLGHRLSLGNEDAPVENRISVSRRLEVEQPEVTISIPEMAPKTRNNGRRKGADTSTARGIRSPLQGASSKKRNCTKKKVVPAKKKLCQDQVPLNKDSLPAVQRSPPIVKLIPAAKKAKSKVDLDKSSSLVVGS